MMQTEKCQRQRKQGPNQLLRTGLKQGLRLLELSLLLLLCLGLNGCSTRELEDRGFPLAIGIDKQEEHMVLSFDFPDLSKASEGKNPSGQPVSFSVEAGAYYEAQKAYENNTNKVLDYNHLKAIVIGAEFLEDEEALRELFAWLEQEEVMARNTCLFAAKGQAAEILTLTEETSGSVGKYLEQMVETQEDFKENKVMTIGELMNQWHNQNELLLIPVLTNNGEVPSITEYASIDAFSYKGNLSVEEAMKAFLCQDLLRRFLYRLDSGEVLQIEGMRTKMEIAAQGEQILVMVDLSGKAQLKKKGVEEEVPRGQLQKRLNRQLSDSLNRAAEQLRKEPGIDLTNSFIRLGGYNRELYRRYRQSYEQYLQALTVDVRADLKLINE